MCVTLVFYLLTRCPDGQTINILSPTRVLRVKPEQPNLLIPSQPPRQKKGKEKSDEGKETKEKEPVPLSVRIVGPPAFPNPLKARSLNSLGWPRTNLPTPRHLTLIHLLHSRRSRSPGRQPPSNRCVLQKLQNSPLWPPHSTGFLLPVPSDASTRSPFQPALTDFGSEGSRPGTP